jgi:hypothetical protein
VKETKLKTVANILATAIVMGLRSTLMGLVITIMGGSVPAQAFLPLASLAGNFAGYGNGTFALCFNSGFSQTVDCKAAAHTVFYSQVSVDQGASDTKGNACSTDYITSSPEFPFPPFPANTQVQIVAVTTTSYNATTGTAHQSFEAYDAANGASCNGSVLVNPGNAPVIISGTQTVVISMRGTRADGITDTLEAFPISDIDNVVLHGVSFKQ